MNFLDVTDLYIALRITSYNVCYTKLLRAHTRSGGGGRERNKGKAAHHLLPRHGSDSRVLRGAASVHGGDRSDGQFPSYNFV